jgi:homoserine kinase
MLIETECATAFAPAGVGNVGVGFDVLGHVFNAIGDRVTVRRIDRRTVEIGEITGCAGPLPTDPTKNTATAGLFQLQTDLELDFGFEVSIEKGIPVASGMGGSAASAVGALVAANALLPKPLERRELFAYTLIGEAVASGAFHGDNLAPGLLGGMTLIASATPLHVVEIPVPEAIRCVVVHPDYQVETRMARGVLPREVPMSVAVEHGGYLAGFVAGCYRSDFDLIAHSLRDILAEPHRASLVPGFAGVKAAALEAGALACTLSGAGPSMFAWCVGDASAEKVCDAMRMAFAEAGLAARGWFAPVNDEGARIVDQR